MQGEDATGATALFGLARDVSRTYESVPGLAMSLVAGSVARGINDASSDLDVYVYWSHLDLDAMASGRAAAVAGDRSFGMRTPTGFFEKYRRGDLLVDVESVEIAALEHVALALEGREPLAPAAMKTMAGIRDAVPLHGEATLQTWKSRLTYSSERAHIEAAANLRRYLPPRKIHELTAARGDFISFSARLSAVALAAIGAVAAVNRYPLDLQDPKWLPWHVSRLRKQPENFARRLQVPFAHLERARLDEFAAALAESLDLVENELPGTRKDVERARWVLGSDPATT